MTHWIQGAIAHPGALHRMLHVPTGQSIPHAKLEQGLHSDNALERRRALLAQTLMHMHRE